VHEELPLRHPQHRHHTVGDLIRFLEAPGSRTSDDRTPARSKPSTRPRTARPRLRRPSQ
jgi:hypothetical protein